MEKDELSLSLSRSVFSFPLTKPYRSPERRSAGLETEDLFGPVNRIHRIRSFRRINDPSPIHIFADISFHCLSTIRPDAYRSRVSRTTFVSPIIVYTVTREKGERARKISVPITITTRSARVRNEKKDRKRGYYLARKSGEITTHAETHEH